MSLYATEAMRALGSSFSTYVDELDQQTRPTLAGLELPQGAFPLFAMSAADDYAQSLAAVGAVTTALRDTFDAIGTALHRVAGHYEQLEADQAAGFQRARSCSTRCGSATTPSVTCCGTPCGWCRG